MDGMSGMGGDGSSSTGPLSPAGVDFNNATQAMNFLGALLNDDELKLVGNRYAQYFWYGVASVVGVAGVINAVGKLTHRSSSAARGERQSARPQNFAMRYMATATAVVREATYLQFTPTQRVLGFQIPPVGTILLLLTYLGFVLALEFINDSVPGAQFWEARGVRAGWLATAQIPLLILLVMKTNIIGAITGVSLQRLNVLHRWTARVTLLLTCLHFGYQAYSWHKYDVFQLEWSTDFCIPTGLAAFALLLWMNVSTLVPFRFWSYEIFVLQHIITFFGFIIAIMIHLPTTALTSRIYVFIPIGLYIVDRIVRTIWFAWTNRSARTATLTALDGNVTKIVISNKTLKNWSSGSYVQVTIPKFGLLETHPATLLSTPTSHQGDLVFLLKGHKGFTNRIMNGANTSTTALLPHSREEVDTERNLAKVVHRAFINGPYKGSHSDFAAFDSVCLIAGSTGVTFTLSVLQDLAERVAAASGRLPLRRLHFVWCVKDVSWMNWCNEEISRSFAKLSAAGVEIKVSIYVTCVDTFTDSTDDVTVCDCDCDKSVGPCCCVQVHNSSDSDSIEKSGALVTSDDSSSKRPSSSIDEINKPARLRILPCAGFRSGRPDIPEVLYNLVQAADGESAVAVCGSVGMCKQVRNTVVRLSDDLAIHKGGDAQGLYLHVESFA